MSVTAAVVGASGYAGGELIRILDAHPGFDLGPLSAHSRSGESLGDVHPNLSGGERVLVPFDADAFANVDVVFLALPHGASAGPAMDLVDRSVTVVDLGSDFRLNSNAAYRNAYGDDHGFPEQLGRWAYGLPELFGDSIAVSDRVAVPGCYPTSAVLAIAPLMGAGLVESGGIVVDSLSGVTGAGRSTSAATSFGAIDESVKAYKVLEHRHQPEMVQAIGAASRTTVELVFTPHLVPMQRGILSTIYLRTVDDVGPDDVNNAFAKTYSDAPFVHVSQAPPETRWVVGSNNAMISFRLDPVSSRLVVLSAIDNLIKGAAGQAVQCANLIFGFDETTGLPATGWMP